VNESRDKCLKCKDYRDCPYYSVIDHSEDKKDRDWFHYGQIRFCPYQIVWILAHAATLRDGRWPQDPDRVDDNLGQRRIKTEASFVKAILILAEVETRLKRTGIHGKLLIAQVEAGREFNTLDYEAKLALLYIKGWRRKKEGFSAWKKRRNYRQKRHQKVVKEGIC